MAGEFLGFAFEDNAIRRLVDAITTAVAISYATVGGTRTDNEDRRRTKMCMEIVRICRGDMKWSVPRILDTISPTLNQQLMGIQWEPSKRPTWGGPNARPSLKL